MECPRCGSDVPEHKGLLEAALESAARGGSNHASGELAFCSHCEMPLLRQSDFCAACGSSVRAVPKSDRGVAVQGVAALRIDVPTLDRET